MAKSALHKQKDTEGIKLKLGMGGQILPFGPPQLSTPFTVSIRIQEAMVNSTPKERSEILDRIWHAAIGQMTTGFSPAALALAYTDWLAHISFSPHTMSDLWRTAGKNLLHLTGNALAYIMGEEGACCPDDVRFHKRYRHESWQRWPYNIIAQAYLIGENWWDEASRIRGMTSHHQNMVAFMHMLALSAVSPENFPTTNPEMQEKIWNQRGMNFLKGYGNALEDIRRWWMGEAPAGTECFQPGKDVALTPGKVIFRNALFELIQYQPNTRETYPEPILIIPAWIMKYYILDLSPHNSMVKYLVEQGHTVFMISWKNPDARYRDVDFTDYLKEGALQALDVVRDITPERKVHTMGYCIGGTLLAMLAAYLQSQESEILQSITLFAAQTDFTEAGQLMTFIDESQVTYLEDIMFSQGYLRGDQISATFDLLKPREFIWHRIAQDYLLGEREQIFDLMAWDKDTTRLPYRMHKEYLHRLYINNKLAEGEFEVGGEALDLGSIESPMFVVTTEHDHIAPWKSVYKIHHFTDAEITFVLANRGHNGGIISEPGHKGRGFRIGKRGAGGRTIPPLKWMKSHEQQEGSWWPDWHEWLASHSGKKTAPPPMGNKTYHPIADAPGEYVHEH